MNQDMISKSIISHEDTVKKGVVRKDGDRYLKVSEFFYDTIQGEGVYMGHPATFLRLCGCTLNCTYCDTKEVWKYGIQYTYRELFELMNSTNCVANLKQGQHLVITGGSPLLQQDRLVEFLNEFKEVFKFKPFIEIENECVLMPTLDLVEKVDCWNNSPKLLNSGSRVMSAYRPEVLTYMSTLPNSWFKFVIDREECWDEIQTFFLNPGVIEREQVILMPMGDTKKQIEQNRRMVINLAIRHNVRYCTREHIITWDKNIGV